MGCVILLWHSLSHPYNYFGDLSLKMCHIMGNPTYCRSEKQRAQINCAAAQADQRLCFSPSGLYDPFSLSIYILLRSVAAQADFCWVLTEKMNKGFLATRLKFQMYFIQVELSRIRCPITGPNLPLIPNPTPHKFALSNYTGQIRWLTCNSIVAKNLKSKIFILKLKLCFLRKTMSPNHLPLSTTLKIMVLSYGDHLNNNILLAEMVIGRNGYGPK